MSTTHDSIANLPELAQTQHQVRIPSELDVALTPRVRAVLDTPAFQRLRQISQLGLVGHVYPGAIHSRFEHSLGVYRLATVVLRHLLSSQPEICVSITTEEAQQFLLAALLHDIGHWPFCHPIEDMRLAWVPHHETLARDLICQGALSDVISQQWGLVPDAVADFLSKPAKTNSSRMLQNILNGPVDIDKMDYLQRDSLHAGVPYGRNFDVARLIASLRIGNDGSSIAITEKGKTAAEMMVFARYVMFSEVYWHHAVRSATAMLQRLVFRFNEDCDAAAWLQMSDATFASWMLELADQKSGLSGLAEGLFKTRRLYKRCAQYNFAENAELHTALARRPYESLLHCSERLACALNRKLARPLMPNDIIIDAPPVKLEVQFNLPVVCKSPTERGQVITTALADVSPVVRSLATDQFDNYVKKVRVFVAPERHADLDLHPHELTDLLIDCVNAS
jgi:uncharacterized protein